MMCGGSRGCWNAPTHQQAHVVAHIWASCNLCTLHIHTDRNGPWSECVSECVRDAHTHMRQIDWSIHIVSGQLDGGIGSQHTAHVFHPESSATFTLIDSTPVGAPFCHSHAVVVVGVYRSCGLAATSGRRICVCVCCVNSTVDCAVCCVLWSDAVEARRTTDWLSESHSRLRHLCVCVRAVAPIT